MKVYPRILLAIFIATMAKSSEQSSCLEVSNDMNRHCGVYCHQVVKPLLSYAASIKSKEKHFYDLQNKIQSLEVNIKSLTELINEKILQLQIQTELTESSKKNTEVLNDQLLIQKKLLASYEKEISTLQWKINLKDTESDKAIRVKDSKITELMSKLSEKDIQINKVQNDASMQAKNCKHIASATPMTQLSSSCLGKSSQVIRMDTPQLKPLYVACDSDLAGDGWIVIQRRLDGSEDFNRNWTDYREGFGNLRRNFFIGLENIFLLTQNQPHELYIYLKDFEDNAGYARYTNFSIGSEAESYKIKSFGTYSGNIGDSFSLHLNRKFATADKDDSQCAKTYKSGWWFTNCSYCDLNGPYTAKGVDLPIPRISWNTWKTTALKFAQLMIRPKLN